MPGIADNALVKAARYIEALGDYEPEPTLIPEAKGSLEAVLGEVPPLDEALSAPRAVHPLLPALVQPLLALTLSPTMIDASHKRNVIPGVCEMTVDCRLLPETDAGRRRADRARRARRGRATSSSSSRPSAGRARNSTPRSGTRSSDFTTTIEPGARLVPLACPGFTDSHFLREAFGTTAYGYFPIRDDGHRARDEAHPLGERADRGQTTSSSGRRCSAPRALAAGGMSETADALVVFGITGDLARRSTLPALYGLTQQGMLDLPVIGVGRRPLSREEIVGHATEAIAAAEDRLDEKVLDEFLSRLTYIGGDAEEGSVYDRLRVLSATPTRPSSTSPRHPRRSSRSPMSSRLRVSSTIGAGSSSRSPSAPISHPRAS